MFTHCNTPKVKPFISSNTIWSFWDGNPPDLVLRCFESMRRNNPTRPVIVVSKATIHQYLEPQDFPLFHGRRGGPDDFSKVQYLSDWVRLTLLEKYGGVWMDASVICTNSVDTWIDPNHKMGDQSKVTMFPMHANPNIHGNWVMATVKPGHPLIREWRMELACILDEVGRGKVPVDYIDHSFQAHPGLAGLWNHPSPPPLPYLWVYLALQVVLQRQPELHSSIHLQSCIDGPMYRRYKYNVKEGVTDAVEVSQKTADDLALLPLNLQEHDRWFVKLVGSDRAPVQEYLDEGNFAEGSALETIKHMYPPRKITYGCDLRVIAAVITSSNEQFRAALRVILADEELLCEEKEPYFETTRSSLQVFSSFSSLPPARRSSRIVSVAA